MTASPSSGTPPAAAARYPDLAGRVAVVTGGSPSIGARTARALAANGTAVAIIGRDEQALAGVADSIMAAGGEVLPIRADATVEADMRDAAATIAERLGPVDVLVPFAGGNGMPVPTPEETVSHWREVVDSDLTATFVCVHAFLPAMVERRRGSIITMSSAAGRQAARSNAAYAAAKAGVIAFTRHLARKVGPTGSASTASRPRRRERAHADMDDRGAAPGAAASFPLQRIGQPEDVAAAALFPALHASAWITGVTLDIAGGKIMV